MSLRSLAFSLPLVLLLASCTIDTTGLSAESSRPLRGNAAAAVVVTEFGDIQCPACRAAHETLNKPLLQKYGDKIGFHFMQFPLSMHPYAMEAAQASECAADQGKFWQFIDLAYEKQDELSSSALRTWAGELKLDADLFDRCVRSQIKRATIESDQVQGEKAGVNSTPTYFVNGQKVLSSIEGISAAIDAELKKGESMPL